MVVALCAGVSSGGGYDGGGGVGESVAAREAAGTRGLTRAHVGEQTGGRRRPTAAAAAHVAAAIAAVLLPVEEDLSARVGDDESVVQRVHDALAPEGQVAQAPELRQRPLGRSEPALDARQLVACATRANLSFSNS